MRNLVFLAIGLLAVLLLLPVVGVVLLVVAGVLVLGVGFLLLAPYLAKLPWFRDRIIVEEHGGLRSVRFGRGGYTAYQQRPTESYTHEMDRPADPDVIDVQGRELPERKE